MMPRVYRLLYIYMYMFSPIKGEPLTGKHVLPKGLPECSRHTDVALLPFWSMRTGWVASLQEPELHLPSRGTLVSASPLKSGVGLHMVGGSLFCGEAQYIGVFGEEARSRRRSRSVWFQRYKLLNLSCREEIVHHHAGGRN